MPARSADWGPEISDLIVDYDPVTLERRDVAKQAVLAGLRGRAPARALRVAEQLPVGEGALLDRAAVDGILLRSHLELQRLEEEFRVAAIVAEVLAPLVAFVRARSTARPIRVVDLGCGLGFIVRWLAAHAQGSLGDDVELVGADYNHTLVAAAQRLAEAEHLPCRFVAGNAFALREPAQIVTSVGVLHHFRGNALEKVFAQHEAAGVCAFAHFDIRPSRLAPLGSWLFHQARMREPLARFDGFWSTVRAHDAATLRAAVAAGAPSFATGTLDARPGLYALLRIFQGVVGVRAASCADLAQALAGLGRRFEATP
jgi:SAM-dependent methyltransferase